MRRMLHSRFRRSGAAGRARGEVQHQGGGGSRHCMPCCYCAQLLHTLLRNVASDGTVPALPGRRGTKAHGTRHWQVST